MRVLFGLMFVCIACSGPAEKARPTPKEQETKQASAKAKPTKEKTAEAPTPIQPDLGPVDLYEWEFKSTAEAQDKIMACAGYQREADTLTITPFKEASPPSPYWIFEISRESDDKSERIAYCTVIPKTSEIQCSPKGAICP